MKAPYMPSGVYPTMITPYNRDRTLDTGALRALTDWYFERGCRGIFASCQSSEIHFLSQADRVLHAETVMDEVGRLAARYPDRPRMSVVASGHISDGFEEQVAELTAIAETGVDAVVLITNRMAGADEGDEVWIRNTDRLLSRLPVDLPLGLYECPNPYKRLLNEQIIDYCSATGRFSFLKDTCCDSATIAARLARMKRAGGWALYNANAQTLLDSLRHGAAGYSGIMANFHPALYVWLCSHFEEEPALAEDIASLLAMSAFIECLAYPVIAKYHLSALEGLPFATLFSRSRAESELSDYQKHCVREMAHLCRRAEDLLASHGYSL